MSGRYDLGDMTCAVNVVSPSIVRVGDFRSKHQPSLLPGSDQVNSAERQGISWNTHELPSGSLKAAYLMP